MDDTARAPRIAALLRRIVASVPGSPADRAARQESERAMLRALQAGGLRAVEQAIRHATTSALPLALYVRPPGARVWRATIPESGALLQISVTSDRLIKSVSVLWAAPPEPVILTASEQRTARIQDAFFERYNAAAERAYATPPLRISAEDRRILFVAAFEADVNNGGFSQYLFNKGRGQAKKTLAILRQIGASKTAAMLERALQAGEDDPVLQKLDDRFYRCREDLAVLSMKAHEQK